MQFMKSIDVGNILMHKSNAVCVIFKTETDDNDVTYYGIDSNSNIHKGTLHEWKNILCNKRELHRFEDSVINNIIAGRRL